MWNSVIRHCNSSEKFSSRGFMYLGILYFYLVGNMIIIDPCFILLCNSHVFSHSSCTRKEKQKAMGIMMLPPYIERLTHYLCNSHIFSHSSCSRKQKLKAMGSMTLPQYIERLTHSLRKISSHKNQPRQHHHFISSHRSSCVRNYIA